MPVAERAAPAAVQSALHRPINYTSAESLNKVCRFERAQCADLQEAVNRQCGGAEQIAGALM
ncbi:hypothetical protein SRHO_G00015250 [Serrasalmus rhombeus]